MVNAGFYLILCPSFLLARWIPSFAKPLITTLGSQPRVQHPPIFSPASVSLKVPHASARDGGLLGLLYTGHRSFKNWSIFNCVPHGINSLQLGIYVPPVSFHFLAFLVSSSASFSGVFLSPKSRVPFYCGVVSNRATLREPPGYL